MQMNKLLVPEGTAQGDTSEDHAFHQYSFLPLTHAYHEEVLGILGHVEEVSWHDV
jgi:hypothetical protein